MNNYFTNMFSFRVLALLPLIKRCVRQTTHIFFGALLGRTTLAEYSQDQAVRPYKRSFAWFTKSRSGIKSEWPCGYSALLPVQGMVDMLKLSNLLRRQDDRIAMQHGEMRDLGKILNLSCQHGRLPHCLIKRIHAVVLHDDGG